MLIDQRMPEWEVRERHRTRVAADVERTFAAIGEADLGSSPLVRALLALRALPRALAEGGWRRGARAQDRITLATFQAHGFQVIGVDEPREILIGLEGDFWRPTCELRPVDAATFGGPVPAGLARGAWNFTVAPHPRGGSLLATETRVLTGDAASRRIFRLYWTLIRPASGLIRRLMLRSIRREAERRTERPGRAAPRAGGLHAS